MFLKIYRKYYVENNSVDNSLSVQDVRLQIPETKQEWKDKNGILIQGSPEETVGIFLQLSSSLPESARERPINLC